MSTKIRNDAAIRGSLSAGNMPGYMRQASHVIGSETFTTPSVYTRQSQQGALGQNGKIYFMPVSAADYRILELTPGVNGPTMVEIPFGAAYDGQSSISAPNGLIYSFPFSYENITSLNPYTHEVRLDVVTGITGSLKYTAAVLHPNGKIYLIPYAATHVGIFDPSNETLDTTSITAPAGSKFSGAALASNGKIYCTPYSVNYVGIIDVVAETMDTTTISVNSGSAKYYGGTLAHNGKIYCAPRNATTVLIIDPSADTAEETSITGLTGNDKYGDSCLAPDGKIYCSSLSTNHVGIIDPENDTIDQTSIPVSTYDYKNYFLILGPDGKIYCAPFYGYSEVIVITPGFSKYPIEPILTSYVNS